MDPLPDITPFQRRLDELNAQMAAPSFYASARRAAEVTREQQKLAQLVASHQAFEKLGRELHEAEALADRKSVV
jgi:peptide chain release factor 1